MSAKKPRKIVIKKYANRRLYNTDTSTYVTLAELINIVKAGDDFEVSDAKTGEDITRSILTQIILEEESKGETLLPIDFLRQIIGFYGDSLQAVLPRYLETTMRTFSGNQDKFRQYLQGMTNLFPFGNFEEFSRQQLNIFEQTMKMLTGFAGSSSERPANAPITAYDLQKQISSLQKKLDEIHKTDPKNPEK
ncbi:MAG: polyhydroxyalkanoate synthesis repressor PhaR [Holosporales bacterium]|jgi:polyhydroxyalkanoate synthesis repressor PhaR